MPDLIDTSILIRHLRGDERAANLLTDLLSRQRPFISPITVAEILVGCRTEIHFRAATTLLRKFKLVPITYAVSEKAAILIRKYPNLFGHQIARGIADAFILACAWERDCTLYTLNTRHFVPAEISEVQIRAMDISSSIWS